MKKGLAFATVLLMSCAWGAPEMTERDGAVASVVGLLLKHQHYAPQEVDDALSKRWLRAYLESLDANHMIFLASDVKEFESRWSDKLDDDVNRMKPQLDAMNQIYSRYEARMAERLTAARATLSGPIDLNTQDTWTPDRAKLPWPATAAEANDLWRRMVVDQVIRGELLSQSRDEILSRLEKRFDRMQKSTGDVDQADVLEIYLDALTQLFDPHTVYFKPATSDNFEIEVNNAVEGIGARLRNEDDYTVVEDVLPGGPAFMDGRLQPGDRIVGVAQGEGEFVDIVGERLDHVVSLIRGKKGTKVRLMVIPVDAPDLAANRMIALVRDQVVLTESDADGSVLDGPTDGPKIGLIDLPSFYADMDAIGTSDTWRGATADVTKILEEFKAQSVDGVILDLRENGGGSLREAVDLAGVFVDRGPVVQVRGNEGRVEVLKDDHPGIVWDGPMLVLTSPLSASASEIVAGAIQDYGRGLVVGAETTHGKGTVQQVLDLNPLITRMYNQKDEPKRSDALKLTTQQFFRVAGGSTQNLGVHSDILLPSPWQGLDIYESDLDNALPWDQIAAADFKAVGSFTAILPELQRRSAERVAASEGFKELAEMLAEREEAKKRTVISLNLEERRAQLEPEDPELSPHKQTDADKKKAAQAADYILQEAASILRDQISMQG